MRKQSIDEKGQVLVFIILAIVAIFGFAALAVDFGRVFSERRRAQNAADAAAYAAAYAGAKSQDWKLAGIKSSQKNGYDDADAAENSGAATDVRIYHPPVRGKYSVASDTIKPNEYYQVIIRTKVNKIFSQFVYQDDLWVEVEAVTHATLQMGFPKGAAIVATCTDCCNAIKLSGNGNTKVNGGSVISNADPDPNSTEDSCPSAWRTGGGTLDITGGSLSTAGNWEDGNKDVCKNAAKVVVPCVTAGSIKENVPAQSYYYPYVPSCSFPPGQIYNTVGKIYNDSKNKIYLSPGYYKGGIHISGKDTFVNFSPGIYCLEGDFDVPGGSLLGSNVMFYMKTGSINIATAQSVSLTAPTGVDADNKPICIPDGVLTEVCWSGTLFYMPPANLGTIYMAGGGSTKYTGTVYAIGGVQGGGYKCKLVGNAEEMTMNTSIICYTVEVAGTNGLTINYDSNLNAQSPGSLELTQ